MSETRETITVPSDVEKDAEAVARQMGLTPRHAHIMPIARAIMAAQKAERERCAGIADGFADRYDVMAFDAGSDDLTPIYAEGERAAMEIAEAIRNA